MRRLHICMCVKNIFLYDLDFKLSNKTSEFTKKKGKVLKIISWTSMISIECVCVFFLFIFPPVFTSPPPPRLLLSSCPTLLVSTHLSCMMSNMTDLVNLAFLAGPCRHLIQHLSHVEPPPLPPSTFYHGSPLPYELPVYVCMHVDVRAIFCACLCELPFPPLPIKTI